MTISVFAQGPLALTCLAACALATPTVSTAQSINDTQLKEVVVTATRTATRVDALVSDLVVIDRSEIDKSSGRTLTELLARSGGVQFSANGGAGKSSSVYTRGTEARHTILLIDGVRYGSATLGTPIWDNIPLDSIERIEILKGPASSLYGSDAVGGVVQIFTRQSSKDFSPRAKLALGSNSYNQVGVGFSGSANALGYSLDVLRSRDKGFSATNSKALFGNFNPDRDPFDQDAVNVNLNYQWTSNWKLNAGLLYADGVSHYDDGLNRDTRTAVRTQTARLGVQGKIASNWQTQLRYGQSVDTSNALVSAFQPSDFKTTQDQLTWQNDIDTPLGVVLLGLENLKQSVSGSTAYTVKDRSVNSAFGGLNGNQGAHSWQLNLRRDSNSQFGASSTGFAGYGYQITPAWRVNTSYGTSFVAPSFNQLYFPGFGNVLLQPERGRNTDVGLTYSQSGHQLKLVYFRNKIKGFITSTTLAANIPQAEIDGWTLSYDGKVGNFSLNASLDALDPRNKLTDKLLPRRNKDQLSLAVDYTNGRWGAGSSLLKAGARFDDVANTAARRLDGYTTMDAYLQYQIQPDWSVQAKVNNLTNADYQTLFGFNQPKRTFLVSLSYQPK